MHTGPTMPSLHGLSCNCPWPGVGSRRERCRPFKGMRQPRWTHDNRSWPRCNQSIPSDCGYAHGLQTSASVSPGALMRKPNQKKISSASRSMGHSVGQCGAATVRFPFVVTVHRRRSPSAVGNRGSIPPRVSLGAAWCPGDEILPDVAGWAVNRPPFRSIEGCRSMKSKSCEKMLTQFPCVTERTGIARFSNVRYTNGNLDSCRGFDAGAGKQGGLGNWAF